MQDTCKDIKHPAGPVAITLAWENSMPDCTLRRLLLDTYTHFGIHDHIQKHWDVFPAAFLQELLKSTLNLLMGTEHAKRPHERSVCYYHEHNEQLAKGIIKWYHHVKPATGRTEKLTTASMLETGRKRPHCHDGIARGDLGARDANWSKGMNAASTLGLKYSRVWTKPLGNRQYHLTFAASLA